jgi:hypothetical protein
MIGEFGEFGMVASDLLLPIVPLDTSASRHRQKKDRSRYLFVLR